MALVIAAAFLVVADSVPEHQGLSLNDLAVARWFAAHRSFEPGRSSTWQFGSGRYWVRTSDLLGVNEALYH